MYNMFDYPVTPPSEVIIRLMKHYCDGIFYETLVLNLARRGYSTEESYAAIDIMIEDGDIDFNASGQLYLKEFATK
jgi:hypothetical protein